MLEEKHTSYHNTQLQLWVEELRKNNPKKSYYIISNPRPDGIEVDPETGKITALEFENSHTVNGKLEHYKSNVKGFDKVFIRCRRSEVLISLKDFNIEYKDFFGREKDARYNKSAHRVTPINDEELEGAVKRLLPKSNK